MRNRANRAVEKSEEFLLKEKTKPWIALPTVRGRIKSTPENVKKLKEVMRKKREIQDLLAEFRATPGKTSQLAADYFKQLAVRRKEMEEIWESIERE